jgi:hypothetical protein
MYDVGTRRMRKHPGYTYISNISYTQLSLKYGDGREGGGRTHFINSHEEQRYLRISWHRWITQLINKNYFDLLKLSFGSYGLYR